MTLDNSGAYATENCCDVVIDCQRQARYQEVDSPASWSLNSPIVLSKALIGVIVDRLLAYVAEERYCWRDPVPWTRAVPKDVWRRILDFKLFHGILQGSLIFRQRKCRRI